MPVFNIGTGEPFRTVTLDGNRPADRTVTFVAGESKSATFAIVVTGEGVPASHTYQWYVNGEAVSGATAATYTRSGLNAAGTYTVYCRVTNNAGTVQSRTATLRVVEYKTPVLNTAYPADAGLTVIEDATGSAALQVKIATAGVPASYTYQWYWNGTAVDGATGASYTRTGLTAGTYTAYCCVTNAAGTVTSRTATVTVGQYIRPVLNSGYPANVNLPVVEDATASATLQVKIATAGVPASYTYQWYWNGEAVSGATAATYTRSGLTAGTYTAYCRVTNAAGTVQSRTATVKVTQRVRPVLNDEYPADTSLAVIEDATGSATLQVKIATAGVPASYTYQWYWNGEAVDGATGASYTRTGLTAGSYEAYCTVTNAAGTVTSRTATVTVEKHTRPVLNSGYPTDSSHTVIESATASAAFHVRIATAGVPASYTYQWYWNGTAVSGATAGSYTRTGLTAGTYTAYCRVTNAAGTVQSRTATVTVTRHARPVLNSGYPADATVMEGTDAEATFQVKIATAGVPASYTYQWYVNNSAVSGATGARYTRTGLETAGTYTVCCKVTNAAGTVTSRTATLTVTGAIPAWSYSGTAVLTEEGGYNWNLALKTSGTLKWTSLGNAAGGVDVFCAGGGGGACRYKGGGGGGYTATKSGVAVAAGTAYTVTIGAGGAGSGTASADGGRGGTTSALGVTAAGGYGSVYAETNAKAVGADGGSGGGGYGGAGGTDGAGGNAGDANWGGAGQGTTTRAFGEAGGALYGSGGNGHAYGGAETASAANTGRGGDGGASGYTGGSGVVIIRNRR